jgi:hypothetical protein
MVFRFHVNTVFGLLHRVVLGDDAKVSDSYAASLFKIEVDPSTLKMETVCSLKPRHCRPQLRGITTQ